MKRKHIKSENKFLEEQISIAKLYFEGEDRKKWLSLFEYILQSKQQLGLCRQYIYTYIYSDLGLSIQTKLYTLFIRSTSFVTNSIVQCSNSIGGAFAVVETHRVHSLLHTFDNNFLRTYRVVSAIFVIQKIICV